MLTRLELESVRRFDVRTFDFSAKTAICGPNGSGKTTVLEAIRLLSVGRSLRTSRLDELIGFERPYTRLVAKITNADTSTKLEFFYGQEFAQSPGRTRRLVKNDQEVSFFETIGVLPTVLFLPTDSEMIFGGPGQRRHYLDGIFWQTSLEFRRQYLELQRVLRERSALLFLLKRHQAGRDELYPWNELLIGLTRTIQARRAAYAEFLQTYCQQNQFFSEIQLTVRYQPNQPDLKVIEAEEIRLAQNTYGPQRDELVLALNGRPARQFASRGQARLLLILLKQAEISYLTTELGRPPLFLLDDIFSELDTQRIDQLLNGIAGGTQTIMTCLDPSKVPALWQKTIL